jgi:hypothetical protein
MAKRPGLYANIHAKRNRIKAGVSGEKMRKKGAKGAPAIGAFAKIKRNNSAAKRKG